MKYFHVKVTIHIQDLHPENCKMLIKEDLNNCRDVPSSWMESRDRVKMQSAPKLLCKIKAILVKISSRIFLDIDIFILYFI